MVYFKLAVCRIIKDDQTHTIPMHLTLISEVGHHQLLLIVWKAYLKLGIICIEDI
jgi:hypothetical protein